MGFFSIIIFALAGGAALAVMAIVGGGSRQIYSVVLPIMVCLVTILVAFEVFPEVMVALTSNRTTTQEEPPQYSDNPYLQDDFKKLYNEKQELLNNTNESENKENQMNYSNPEEEIELRIKEYYSYQNIQ